MWLTFREEHAKVCSLFEQLSKLGFESVSLAHCQSVIQALNLLDRASETGLTHFRQRLRIRRKLHQLRDGKFTAQAVWQMKRMVALCHEMQRTQKYSRLLDDGKFWSAQFDTVRNDRKRCHQIMKLSKEWLNEGRYAQYSMADLLFVYHTVLPLLANWLHYGQQELALKSDRLRPALKAHYTAYLKGLFEELKMEQRMIRSSLLSRLTGFSAQGYFNPVFAFINRLQQFMGRVPAETNEMIADMPTAEQFYQAQQIIETEGEPEEKTQLYALPYYDGLSDVEAEPVQNTLYRKTHTGSIYRLPLVVQSYIPFNPPFYVRLPQFLWGLFKSDQVRYHFFQHETCQFLVMMNWETLSRGSLPVDISILNVMTTSTWQLSVNRLNNLAKEKQRTQIAMASLFSWFHRESWELLQTYERWLDQEAIKTLSYQIQQLTIYLDARVQKEPLTEPECLQLEAIIQTLELQNHQWGSSLSLELAILRMHLLRDTKALAENVPFFVQKPREQMTFFEQLYTDLLRMIYEYESTHLILLPEDEKHLKVLKAILKEQEQAQDVIQLRKSVAAYQSQINAQNTDSWLNLFLDTEHEFTTKLENLLNQRNYQEATIYARAQVSESTELKEQSTFLQELTVQLKIPLENPSFSMTFQVSQLAWIKNPLEKEMDELKNDMRRLQSYQKPSQMFKYQVLGYLYYFVTALANVSSKAEFESKRAVFQYILAELVAMDQQHSVGLGGFLNTLKTAEAHLLEPIYRNNWNLFVKNHFELIANFLHQKHLAVIGVPKVTITYAAAPEASIHPTLPLPTVTHSSPSNR